MSHIKRTLFREYDIRGRESEQELNARSAFLIGRSYGSFLREHEITAAVIGHDNRLTSEAIHAAIKDALVRCGIHVIDIGLATTPMLYWAQLFFHRKERLNTQGGVMVTASHNPAGWNGLKLAKGYCTPLSKQDLDQMYRFILEDTFAEGRGSSEERTIFQEYVTDLTSRVKIPPQLKVVVNAGNATAGVFCPKVFRSAGCQVVEYLTSLDPHYPHYTPNPAALQMMEDTGRVVREHGADIGLAFDTDGDRLGITDELGNVIWPDRYLILLSRQVLQKHPAGKIIFDVKCSNALQEDIEIHGGIPLMWKTGHAYIKSKLQEEGAVLGGEMSGHVFFADDYYGFDDATFAALKLIEYRAQKGQPLSRLIADTPYYLSTPTLNAECRDLGSKRADVYKYEVVDELLRYFKAQYSDVIDINGVRVTFPNGAWGLVRASSNLPALVMRFEAKTKMQLDEIIEVFRQRLDTFPGVSKHWYSA